MKKPPSDSAATSARKSPAKVKSAVAPIDSIIHTVRGERVILDADLARIYGVTTKAFNQAVRRNREKFPPDFLLELTNAEAANLQRTRKQEDTILRSQIVTLKHGQHLKYRPFAFTEHGALMAATILNSPQASEMSVFVIRAFIKMRGLLTDTRELAKKLASLETELKSRLDVHETAIVDVLQRIMLLLEPPAGPEIPAKDAVRRTEMAQRSSPKACLRGDTAGAHWAPGRTNGLPCDGNQNLQVVIQPATNRRSGRLLGRT